MEPAALAGGCIERTHAAVVAAHQHQALRDGRRGDDFVRYLGPPLLGAIGLIQRDHVTGQRADHHQALAHTRTTGQALLELAIVALFFLGLVFPHALAGLQIQRLHATGDGGRIHLAICHGRTLTHTDVPLALAHAGGPQLVDLDRRLELDQFGRFLRLLGSRVLACEPTLDGAAPRQRHAHQGDQCNALVHINLLHQIGSAGSGTVPPTSISLVSSRRRCGDATSTVASALV